MSSYPSRGKLYSVIQAMYFLFPKVFQLAFFSSHGNWVLKSCILFHRYVAIKLLEDNVSSNQEV